LFGCAVGEANTFSAVQLDAASVAAVADFLGWIALGKAVPCPTAGVEDDTDCGAFAGFAWLTGTVVTYFDDFGAGSFIGTVQPFFAQLCGFKFCVPCKVGMARISFVGLSIGDTKSSTQAVGVKALALVVVATCFFGIAFWEAIFVGGRP
jgi:hypothetical protein